MDNYQSHSPSKWTVATVFFVIIALIIGVFLWAFYFNKGAVVLRSDRGFQFELGSSSTDCSMGTCEVSLTPGVYEGLAVASGYYDEPVSFEIFRADTTQKEILFRLIPYLSEVSDLPVVDVPEVSFDVSESTYQLKTLDGTTLVSFESLSDPQLEIGLDFAAVVDSGRLFVVDLNERRSRRYFDDSVQVGSAQMSDSGERVLIFADVSGQGQVLLLKTVEQELFPLALSVSPEQIVWKPDYDYLIYVLSDELGSDGEGSVLDDLLTSVTLGETTIAMGLYEYNLDTRDRTLIQEFDDELPVQLVRRNKRVFVEYEGQRYEEIVFQEGN